MKQSDRNSPSDQPIINAAPKNFELGITHTTRISPEPMVALNERPIHRDGSNGYEYVAHDAAGRELFAVGPGIIYIGHELVRCDVKLFQILEQAAGRRPPAPLGSVSFVSEQQALLKDSSVRAQDMIDQRDIEDEPGTVRIHRKKTEWMLALATQKVIANNISAVKEYLNEGNPNPYTAQQLNTVTITPDRRRHNKGYIVSININGDGPNEVAFLSGPLAG